MQRIFETVAIVGPGLIGGSLGLALRARGLAGRVVGVGRRQSSLDQALRVGAVDEASLDAEAGVREADLVVLATPIRALARLMPALTVAMKPGAMLTEVASTKQTVIAAVTRALEGRADLAFIPTHPMAGSEKRGALNASADLFAGSVCIFTPLEGTPSAQVGRLRAMWEAVGAAVHVMTPVEHDRLVARISHLPHLAAAALMEIVSPQEGAFAGGGLMDTTRVASGDPALWRDICQANAAQIAEALAAYGRGVEGLRALLEQGDMEGLAAVLRSAKDKRDGLMAQRRGRDPSQQQDAG